MPMMMSVARNSLKAWRMPLAMFAATRTCVCIVISADALYCAMRSSSWLPFSMLRCMSSSSYTTFRPTSCVVFLGLRMSIARLTRRCAYSGYFSGMRIFSSAVAGLSSLGISRSRSVICCAARSVIIVEMMHVTRIMSTTLFSMSSVTSGLPGSSSTRIPIMSMAMAPAACAEVSPNIMLPDDFGSRNMEAAVYAAIALPSVPKPAMTSIAMMMVLPSKSSRTLMSMPTPMRK